MQADLTTNSASIMDSFNKIREGKSGIDWMLLDYEGKTSTIIVKSTGDGGIEELQEEFNDGKIQFAFLRVIDENTQLPKFVFISWCGEGVPENRKGLLQMHTQAVEKVLKGFHLHILARSEKDVDKETIMKKVKSSSGANYSFHKEKPVAPEKPAPVGSNYQKPEIMGRSKDVAPQPASKPAPPPAAKPAPQPLAKPTFLNNNADEARKKQELEEQKRLEEEKRRKEEEERRRREEEERRKEEERRRREEEERRRREEEERKKRAEGEERSRREEEESRRREEEERRRREEEEERRRIEEEKILKSSKPTKQGSGISAEVLYDYDAADDSEINLVVGTIITDIEKIDEGWWRGTNSQNKFGMFPSSYVQEVTQSSSSHGAGTTAVALYDYEAGDQSEIDFVTGETIVEIAQIDEGWSQGRNPRGHYGMFPSNYVQFN